ncbi:SWI/SNF-related matrix-associated actin-dependent regulator of chromatin subfamily A-like protein 1 isoform X1 [Bombus fervidus]|uniref:SWI/SNF-related matrix-associated actin-dependent regulator of chromatin subfamily A-like protein 1 isoform X1 n=2 Tax=Bombus fervidus TaxID=203811 RepID=UPI003AB5FADF
MSYSQEEIEKKRLLALQRKKESQLKNNSFIPNTNTRNSITSTNSSIITNENKLNNSPKVFGHSSSKYVDYKAKSENNCLKHNGKLNKQNERFNPMSTKNFFGQKSCITAKCYMLTDERFVLETSSYFPPLVETIKKVSSRSYDMKTKQWNFLLKDYETVMEKVINFKSDIQITGLPKPVLQIFRKNDTTMNTENIDLLDIDPQLVENLMPFQREGVCYGISKGGRCMIADDMGLGKTIQALGIAHYFRKNWPLLIVAPASVRYQWAEAIYTFLPSVPAHYIHQFANTKDFIDSSKIVIITYDLLVRAMDKFERKIFGFVILDESHALKSVKTARFKAAQCVVLQACHVVLLSGTPALSRPIELYSQINLIMPNFMGYQEYGIRYCAGEKTSYGWDFNGSSNMQELQLLLKRTCVIRRLKNDVLNQLPAKKREVIILDPGLIKVGTKEMVEISKKLEREVLNGMEKHHTLLQYYNESGVAKQKAICDYISKLFMNKQKFIIFAHHQNVMDAICDVAEFMDRKYIRIDGKTNPERRKYQIDQFQNCDDCMVAVLSITAANAGITLTAAKLVVFAELFWNPGILCQAEDRVHRIGQDNSVIIQYLVAKQTADDYLWPLIQKKMNVLNEVGLDQNFSLKDIDVTIQAFSSEQKTLDSFTDNSQKIVHSNENATKNTSQSQFSTTEEFKELLDLNEEDFEFCDWDDMK